jgi:hypothetical protein
MQVHSTGYDLTDHFKKPTEPYILELTRVIIQLFLYYPWMKSNYPLNISHIHVDGMKTY